MEEKTEVPNPTSLEALQDGRGKIHPLMQVQEDCIALFSEMGFEVADGPEMEDQFHNFDALNVPKDHPARDMQDTFFVKGAVGPDDLPKVMRTHTSPVQVRYMEKHGAPVRIIVPGKVFRNEATDATHEAQFHQIEGLMVDKDVTLGHLKGTLLTFFKKYLGDDIDIRLRPGYFPFVEPGVEVDLRFNDKWLEVLGAGMVHPNTLKAAGLNPDEYQGFAFGMGIDRIAMMKYNFKDVRDFYTGDLRLHYGLK